jgi:hypothetical protein
MERTNKNRIVVVVILCRKNCDFFAKSPIVNYYGRNKHLSERETLWKGKTKIALLWLMSLQKNNCDFSGNHNKPPK